MYLENQFFSLHNKFERELFKEKSGIYGLYFNNECFYVGQSKDLYKRLTAHSNPESRLNEYKKRKNFTGRVIEMYEFIKDNLLFIEFKILRFCDYSELNSNEETFISLYKPKYNYSGLDVDYYAPERDKETGKIIYKERIPIGFEFYPKKPKKKF